MAYKPTLHLIPGWFPPLSCLIWAKPFPSSLNIQPLFDLRAFVKALPFVPNALLSSLLFTQLQLLIFQVWA